mgnify:CR=1 FL=1
MSTSTESESSLDIRILTRDLTPFEHLVAEHMCEGKSNAAIARLTSHTEKVIENTVYPSFISTCLSHTIW